VDVLAGGSERPPSRAAALLARLPPGAVAAALAAVLAAGLLAVGEVEQARRAADDVSAVEVRLVVGPARRAGDGSAFGAARVQVDDPAGRDVRLLGLDAGVPGVRLGPAGVGLDELAAGPRVALPLRFAVPDCAELVLPGRVSARVARRDGPSATVTAPLDEPAARALRRLCGQQRVPG